ncbi:MAG: class I SAM-dependent methyltransferase [Candidatus Paceibacterota bacterium]|jgi:hypothetical protein
MQTKLNLGSGHFPLKGYLNVDINVRENPDLVLDLNNPKSLDVLPSNHFEHIVLDHCLEHLSDVFGIMIQVHRLLAKDGVVEIRVPHFSRGFTHPEHQRGFDFTFAEYFNPGFKGGFSGAALKVKSMKLTWMIRWDLKAPYVNPLTLFTLKVISAILSFLANLGPYLCSRVWCYWFGGFEQLEYIFQK